MAENGVHLVCRGTSLHRLVSVGSLVQADAALHLSPRGRCGVASAPGLSGQGRKQPWCALPQALCCQPTPQHAPLPPGCLHLETPRASHRVAARPERFQPGGSPSSSATEAPVRWTAGSWREAGWEPVCRLSCPAWYFGGKTLGLYSQALGKSGSLVLTTQNHISKFQGYFGRSCQHTSCNCPWALLCVCGGDWEWGQARGRYSGGSI